MRYSLPVRPDAVKAELGPEAGRLFPLPTGRAHPPAFAARHSTASARRRPGGPIFLRRLDHASGRGKQERLPRAVDPNAPSRLTLNSLHAGETTWQPVWSTAVQVRNDEQIELTSPIGANDRLMFWAYAVDKDKWAIDSLCALTTPVRLSSESSKIIETGKYQEIAVLKTEDREYRVFQTVLNMKPDRNS